MTMEKINTFSVPILTMEKNYYFLFYFWRYFETWMCWFLTFLHIKKHEETFLISPTNFLLLHFSLPFKAGEKFSYAFWHQKIDWKFNTFAPSNTSSKYKKKIKKFVHSQNKRVEDIEKIRTLHYGRVYKPLKKVIFCNASHLPSTI